MSLIYQIETGKIEMEFSNNVVWELKDLFWKQTFFKISEFFSKFGKKRLFCLQNYFINYFHLLTLKNYDPKIVYLVNTTNISS